MKKIITLLLLTFIVSTSYAQYTPMTAAGYQFKRILCDSTLHIPSFCGIPTLRNSTAKNGAIAMDTCNYRFYMWTNIGGWSQIVGVGTDTTSLSNRIDQRVKYTDTAQMLLAYLRKQDTANRFVANVTKVNDSTIRVFKGNTITDLKILGKGTDTTSLSTRIDSRVKYTDTAAMLLPYLRKVDTTAMLSKYLRKTDTASLSNRINLKLNISDTATMLSKYLRKTDTASLSNRINLKLNISDTATMLSKYLRKTDTASLSNRINLKLNIADTTNKFVNNVTKINDSTIRVWKGTSSTDLLIRGNASGGGGATPTLQQVTTAGATTIDPVFLNDNITGLWHTELNNIVSSGSTQYYPIKWSDDFFNGYGYIKSYDDVTGANLPEFKMGTITGTPAEVKLNTDEIAWKHSNTTKLIPYEVNNDPGYDYTLRLPVYDGFAVKDTLATLKDLRNGGGGTPIDTTGAFVIDVIKKNDSTITVYKGSTATDITLTPTTTITNATRLITTVYNNSGSTITKGSVVYINGAHSSNLPTIALAKANSETTSAYTYGLVENDIATSNSGTVIQVGSITNLNLPTSTYTDGQTLYLSPTTAGGYTTTKPFAPNHYVSIGTITRAHPTFGTIQIAIRNGFQLDELSDVLIAAVPNDSTLLQFSRVDSLWHDVSVVNAIGNKYIKPSDTSVFQRKSISANTIMANNTASAANVTAQAYYDVAEQNMGNTITWTGTAPTSLTSANYAWQQIGKTVTMQFNALYANAGVSNTGYFFTLPSDMPAPAVPTGWTGASGYLYTGTASTHNTFSTINSNVAISYIRRNAANTAFEVGFIGTGVSARGFKINITYKAQ